MELSTFITILPVIVSLALILITRKTVIALLVGALIGAIIANFEAPSSIPNHLWNALYTSLKSDWHYSAIFFTICLGAFASLLEAGGGLNKIFKNVSTRKSLELRTIGLGLICFFDGLASSVLIARLVRPMADRLGLPREKVAYLADSTSSAIACIAPISTWIAMQLGLISVVLSERALEASPYSIFLKSIPYNFYCIFTLLLTITLALKGKDYGPMATAQPVAIPSEEEQPSKSNLTAPLLSICILLISIPVLYYIFETPSFFPISFTKLADAMGGSSGPKVFIWSGIISIITVFLSTSNLTIKKRALALGSGAKQMLIPMVVLIAAWIFGSILKDLGLAKNLSSLIGNYANLQLLPCIIFLLGCVLSFTTGTSWGTMALLFPIAFGLTSEIPNGQMLTLFPILIGAIFSGSVFGDHCSPYSDTTIVSAIAVDCEPFQHVKTQLPYALTCGMLAAIFFLITGLI